MKQFWTSLKSAITILMTLGMLALLFIPNLNPPTEIVALFCTSYGAIITFYFTKKEDKEE